MVEQSSDLRGASSLVPTVVLYARVLPGGGLVTIESQAHGESRSKAVLRVERRGDPQRRAGHFAPVLLERELIIGESPTELYEVATSNVSLARCLIDWQKRGRASP